MFLERLRTEWKGGCKSYESKVCWSKREDYHKTIESAEGTKKILGIVMF